MAVATDSLSVVIIGVASHEGIQAVLEYSTAGYKILGIDQAEPPENILPLLSKFILTGLATDRAVEETLKANSTTIVFSECQSEIQKMINKLSETKTMPTILINPRNKETQIH